MSYKLNQNCKNKKYQGYTLVEMLITIVIIAIVLLTVTVTLTALIKASMVVSARTLTRNESEFMLELIDKYASNSREESVLVFKSTGRSLTATNTIAESSPTFTAVAKDSYSNYGNEIHFKPVGSDSWVCLGHFAYTAPDGELFAYIVKTTADGSLFANDTAAEHSKCFKDNLTGTGNPNLYTNILFLNSSEVSVTGENSLTGQKLLADGFKVYYFEAPSGNIYFDITLRVMPIHWVAGERSELEPIYTRKLILSTGKLTF